MAGRGDLHRKGTTPRRSNRVAFALAARWKSPGPGANPSELPPPLLSSLRSRTAKNHRVVRKAAARRYLVPPLFVLPRLSRFSSWSVPSPSVLIFPPLLDTIYELSRQPFPRTLHILPLPYQVLLSILLFLLHSIRSLIKYICLARTHTREHAHLIIMRIIPVRGRSYLDDLVRFCSRNSFIFFLSTYRLLFTRFRIFREFAFFTL